MTLNNLALLIGREAFQNRVRSKQPKRELDSLRRWVLQSINTHFDGGQLERGCLLLKGVGKCCQVIKFRPKARRYSIVKINIIGCDNGE